MKTICCFVFIWLAVATFAAVGARAQNAALDFEIVNLTGYDIEHVYIAPSSSEDWGDDVLEGGVLKKNESVSIIFSPKAKAKIWDLSVGWVGYSSDEDVEWTNLDLSTIEKLTLHYDAKQNKTWATVE